MWFRRRRFDFWARKFPDRPSRDMALGEYSEGAKADEIPEWARWVQHPGLVFPDLDPHILQVARMTGKKRAMELTALLLRARGYQVFTVDPKSIEGFEEAEPLVIDVGFVGPFFTIEKNNHG